MIGSVVQQTECQLNNVHVRNTKVARNSEGGWSLVWGLPPGGPCLQVSSGSPQQLCASTRQKSGKTLFWLLSRSSMCYIVWRLFRVEHDWQNKCERPLQTHICCKKLSVTCPRHSLGCERKRQNICCAGKSIFPLNIHKEGNNFHQLSLSLLQDECTIIGRKKVKRKWPKWKLRSWDRILCCLKSQMFDSTNVLIPAQNLESTNL